MENNSLKWLKKEIQKDELQLRNHKKNIISQIKESGVEGVLKRPKKKEKKDSLWKKLRNLLRF
jgi:hypothetical protein